MTWDDQPQEPPQNEDEQTPLDADSTEMPDDRAPVAQDNHVPLAQDNHVPVPLDALPPQRSFEDLTLAEAVGEFWHAPLATLRAISAVARTPKYSPANQAQQPSVFASPAYVPPPLPKAASLSAPGEPPVEVAPIPLNVELAQEYPANRGAVWFQLILRVIGLGLAVVGGLVMLASPIRSEQGGLDVGAPYLLAGFVAWLVAELVPVLSRSRLARAPEIVRAREAVLDRSPSRVIAAGLGTVAVILTWLWNDQNLFTLEGVIAWGASIALWVWALAPAGWTPITGMLSAGRWVRSRRLRFSWTLVALVGIMIVGGYFRFADLSGTPPEMTSDHVEKLLDVNRVLHGATNVFFANNHGRDAIQFYLLAGMSYLPGLQLDFFLLKLLTVIEGLITLPVLWWMGRAIIGEDEPRLGNAVGLALAALVAVSYWHEMLSRLGLRIVLTPLFTALVIIFLARGLRHNRRSDFLWAGVALGAGVYAYQSIRMLPVAVVVGVGIALIFSLRSLVQRRQMMMNLVALVIVSFVIFVPLFHYSVEYPEDFWRRASGRLFGDELTQTTDENGNLVMRVPSLQERISAFNQNVPVLLDNFRNAMLMYNWKGDVAWINNAPNEPAFDVFTGGLLIVGVAAWLARMFRRRDAFDWTLLPLILIMMLPSALSIAYPIENPSATRMSGTLPGVYLLAALPLALIALALPRVIGKIGAALAVVGAVGVAALSFSANWQTFFGDYRASYIANSLPYSAGATVMRDFAVDQGNGYGNVFILAYPYWWDHRALAIDAGKIDWGNTIQSLDDVPSYLQQAVVRPDADLRLDVDKDILFFYSPDDALAQEWLQANFPDGEWQNMQTYQTNHSFNIYRAPAPGEAGFTEFLAANGLQPIGG